MLSEVCQGALGQQRCCFVSEAPECQKVVRGFVRPSMSAYELRATVQKVLFQPRHCLLHCIALMALHRRLLPLLSSGCVDGQLPTAGQLRNDRGEVQEERGPTAHVSLVNIPWEVLVEG